MGFHARDGDVVPALPQRASHDANHGVVRLQHRPLFDMSLEVRAGPGFANRCRAGIANGLECILDGDALPVGLHQQILEDEFSDERARSHHHGHEARSLFVRPDGHFERGLGDNAVVVERPEDLDAGEHAVVPVELAACRLGVDVASGHDGRQAVVAATSAREDIADGVDADRAAGRFRFLHEEIPALAVQIGQCKTADTPFGGRANLGKPHQRVPQAGAVDAHIMSDAGGCLRVAHAVSSAMADQTVRPTPRYLSLTASLRRNSSLPPV